MPKKNRVLQIKKKETQKTSENKKTDDLTKALNSAEDYIKSMQLNPGNINQDDLEKIFYTLTDQLNDNIDPITYTIKNLLNTYKDKTQNIKLYSVLRNLLGAKLYDLFFERLKVVSIQNKHTLEENIEYLQLRYFPKYIDLNYERYIAKAFIDFILKQDHLDSDTVLYNSSKSMELYFIMLEELDTNRNIIKQEALLRLKEATAKYPEETHLLLLQGYLRLYWGTDSLEKILELYNEVKKRDPEFVFYINKKIHKIDVLISNANEKHYTIYVNESVKDKRFDDAIAAIDNRIELCSNIQKPHALIDKAYIYIAQENYEKARETIVSAETISKDFDGLVLPTHNLYVMDLGYVKSMLSLYDRDLNAAVENFDYNNFLIMYITSFSEKFLEHIKKFLNGEEGYKDFKYENIISLCKKLKSFYQDPKHGNYLEYEKIIKQLEEKTIFHKDQAMQKWTNQIMSEEVIESTKKNGKKLKTITDKEKTARDILIQEEQKDRDSLSKNNKAEKKRTNYLIQKNQKEKENFSELKEKKARDILIQEEQKDRDSLSKNNEAEKASIRKIIIDRYSGPQYDFNIKNNNCLTNIEQCKDFTLKSIHDNSGPYNGLFIIASDIFKNLIPIEQEEVLRENKDHKDSPIYKKLLNIRYSYLTKHPKNKISETDSVVDQDIEEDISVTSNSSNEKDNHSCTKNEKAAEDSQEEQNSITPYQGKNNKKDSEINKTNSYNDDDDDNDNDSFLYYNRCQKNSFEQKIDNNHIKEHYKSSTQKKSDITQEIFSDLSELKTPEPERSVHSNFASITTAEEYSNTLATHPNEEQIHDGSNHHINQLLDTISTPFIGETPIPMTALT